MNIYDIAEKSGVSIATISRVLNGGKNVSKKTYDKVMNIMKEEGYTPNVFARGLGLNTMKTIGILVADVADIHYAQMISFLTEYLRELGMDVLLSCTGWKKESKKAKLELLLQKRVDAIFLAGSAQQELDDNSHIAQAATQVPIIMVNGYIDEPGIINVSSDEYHSVCQCVRFLSQSGLCHPLYLYDNLTYSGNQKLLGYIDGIKLTGLPEDKRRIVQTQKDLVQIQQTVSSLIKSGVKFDSVIASEDIIAIGAQKALLSQGRNIPVIGFNNSVLAEVSSPTLTSVDNMLEPICRTAVQLYKDVLDGKTTSSRVTIGCKLIERESYQISSHYPSHK